MAVSPALLGQYQFPGNYNLEFRSKTDRVVAKLYKEGVKEGACYLYGVTQFPFSVDAFPEAVRVKFYKFLASYDINPASGATGAVPVPASSSRSYVASIKGPFEGLFPKFINRRYILSYCFGNPLEYTERYGLIKYYDLQENKLVYTMSKWHISLFQRPIYTDPNTGIISLITDRGIDGNAFVTAPIFSEDVGPLVILSVNETSLITADKSGSLKVWDIRKINTCIQELKVAVSCGYTTLDYTDSDDEEASHPEKLICNESIVVGEQKIAVFTGDRQLNIWDLTSGQPICSLTSEVVLQNDLAFQDPDYETWKTNFSFHGDGLLIKNYKLSGSSIQSELFFFELTSKEKKPHELENGEIFIGVFNGKVLSVLDQNLYFRDLCSNAPRVLFMPLDFEIKRVVTEGNRIVIITKSNKVHFIDVAQKSQQELIPPEHNINWDFVHEIRYVEDCLFIVVGGGDRFQLCAFDFSANPTSTAI